MSGIYIKGMEMPTYEQGVRTINIYADGVVTNYVEETIATAIPVPDHGRLIDADALEDRCSRQARDEWNKSTGANWGYAYATFESDVEDAPTIIPADKEGEG